MADLLAFVGDFATDISMEVYASELKLESGGRPQLEQLPHDQQTGYQRITVKRPLYTSRLPPKGYSEIVSEEPWHGITHIPQIRSTQTMPRQQPQYLQKSTKRLSSPMRKDKPAVTADSWTLIPLPKH